MAVQTRQAELASASGVIAARGAGNATERFQTPDRLFLLLDGRTVVAAGQLWKAEIFGIRDASGQRWVQVGLENGDAHRMVTLRLSAGGTLQDALAALASLGDDTPFDPAAILSCA